MLTWFITGAVLIIITGKIPSKKIYQPWVQYWLSADCIQHPNTGCPSTWKSYRQLAFDWLNNAAVLINITVKMPTYYFHNLLLIYFWHIHSKCIFINNFIIIFCWVFHKFFSFFCKRTRPVLATNSQPSYH